MAEANGMGLTGGWHPTDDYSPAEVRQMVEANGMGLTGGWHPTDDYIWSPLIMGIYPGCRVCSIVAASLVAVETDKTETIAVAKVAFVCGRWSVRVVALLSVGPSSCFCIHQPVSFPLSGGVGSECFSTSCCRPRNRCWCQVLSCLPCRHPCSAVMFSLWISFQMPTLHRECLLGCGHPPCGRHAPANAACAV